MGKKRSRPKYISKGERPNTNRQLLKQVARRVTPLERALNKVRVFAKGGYTSKNPRHNPYVTIDNPDKKQTARRMIRVRMSSLHTEVKPKMRSLT